MGYPAIIVVRIYVSALLLEAVPTVRNRIPCFFPAAVGALTRKRR